MNTLRSFKADHAALENEYHDLHVYPMAPFVGAPLGALFTPSPDNKSLVRCV